MLYLISPSEGCHTSNMGCEQHLMYHHSTFDASAISFAPVTTNRVDELVTKNDTDAPHGNNGLPESNECVKEVNRTTERTFNSVVVKHCEDPWDATDTADTSDLSDAADIANATDTVRVAITNAVLEDGRFMDERSHLHSVSDLPTGLGHPIHLYGNKRVDPFEGSVKSCEKEVASAHVKHGANGISVSFSIASPVASAGAGSTAQGLSLSNCSHRAFVSEGTRMALREGSFTSFLEPKQPLSPIQDAQAEDASFYRYTEKVSSSRPKSVFLDTKQASVSAAPSEPPLYPVLQETVNQLRRPSVSYAYSAFLPVTFCKQPTRLHAPYLTAEGYSQRPAPPYPHIVYPYTVTNGHISLLYTKLYGYGAGTYPMFDDYKRDFSDALSTLVRLETGIATRRKRLREHDLHDRRQALHNPRINTQFKLYEFKDQKYFSLKEVLADLLPYHTLYSKHSALPTLKQDEELIHKKQRVEEVMMRDMRHLIRAVGCEIHATMRLACSRVISETTKRSIRQLKEQQETLKAKMALSSTSSLLEANAWPSPMEEMGVRREGWVAPAVESVVEAGGSDVRMPLVPYKRGMWEPISMPVALYNTARTGEIGDTTRMGFVSASGHSGSSTLISRERRQQPILNKKDSSTAASIANTQWEVAEERMHTQSPPVHPHLPHPKVRMGYVADRLASYPLSARNSEMYQTLLTEATSQNEGALQPPHKGFNALPHRQNPPLRLKGAFSPFSFGSENLHHVQKPAYAPMSLKQNTDTNEACNTGGQVACTTYKGEGALISVNGDGRCC